MKNDFHVAVETNEGSYLGDRGEKFRGFVVSLLAMSGLKKKYVDTLTGPEGMETYGQAFTHISIDAEKNYEFLEILGDATCNKCVVWYIKDRFPLLQNPEGVKVIARLRINLVSKKNFAGLAEKLGFGEYISCDREIREQKGRSLLEDVFEAFIGATEMLVDKLISEGSGYYICFRILRVIFDGLTISLRYEDLYDPITRLKETFDFFRQQCGRFQNGLIWGTMLWENSKKDNGQVVSLYQYDKNNNRRKLLMTAEAPVLDEAKQLAASRFLHILHQQGYKRPIPEYYARIADTTTGSAQPTKQGQNPARTG
jgi:dsRNA-specific ribonuclease